MKRVYVAGPITKGDQFANVRQAILLGDKLYEAGFIPFIPHLTCFWHLLCHHEPKAWYEYDFHWLEKCDVLFRLPGFSIGSDAEMLRAEELGIPVYVNFEELIKNES